MSIPSISLAKGRRTPSERSRRTFRGIGFLSLVLFALCVAVVQAQPDDDDDEEPSDDKAGLVQRGFNDAQFENWVFDGPGGYSRARKRMKALLNLHIEDIDRVCKLTDVQKKKLQLLGRGEIKQFFDHYDKLKRKFDAIKHDQEKLEAIWPEIRLLNMILEGGLFQGESLLAKSLPHTLTSEQLARYNVMVQERRAFRHRATIELAVAMLDKGMPLRDGQRQKFVAVLINETKPLRNSCHPHYYQVMMTQINRIPEEKLKPLFDNAQWQFVHRQLDQFKGFERRFKEMGLWPREEDADEADVKPAAQK